jgi:hypothetical protein
MATHVPCCAALAPQPLRTHWPAAFCLHENQFNNRVMEDKPRNRACTTIQYLADVHSTRGAAPHITIGRLYRSETFKRLADHDHRYAGAYLRSDDTPVPAVKLIAADVTPAWPCTSYHLLHTFES